VATETLVYGREHFLSKGVLLARAKARVERAGQHFRWYRFLDCCLNGPAPFAGIFDMAGERRQFLVLGQRGGGRLRDRARRIEPDRADQRPQHRGVEVHAIRSEQQLQSLLPGALAVERMPIGDARVIETAGRGALVSLYECYYRPERTTLLMVGDFDVDQMEKKIIAKFGDWAGKGEPGRDPDLAYTPPVRPSAASAFVHKDGGDSIAVYSLRPYRDEPDTAGQRRLDNLLMFGIGALGRRLAPMANAEDPLFRSAGVTSSDILRTVDSSAGSVTLTP